MTLHELTPRKWRATAVASVLAVLSSTMPISAATNPKVVSSIASTQTPIQHVIVIIGENRTFDHMFATYQPVARPNHQQSACRRESFTPTELPDRISHRAFRTRRSIPSASTIRSARPCKSLYGSLPTPLAGGPTTPYFSTLQQAMEAENGLADDYYQYMMTGGTGLQAGTPDTRIQQCLQPSFRRVPTHQLQPLILTMFMTTARYTASTRCGSSRIAMPTTSPRQIPAVAPRTCFPGLKTSIGAGSNGRPPAVHFNQASTGEGATAMSFYNVQQGDAPYLKYLADNLRHERQLPSGRQWAVPAPTTS